MRRRNRWYAQFSLKAFNTLGFDAELIDYIDYVDDSIVLQKIAPNYKAGGRSVSHSYLCV
jgi:hypothetical protein